jgi:capsular exopolysaccharide synthesis family protein
MDAAKTPTTPPPETKLHFLDYWRIIRVRKTVILAVFLLVVITATLVTFILPESYSSTARIKVERDMTDITGVANMPVLQNYDPFFVQTEFEVIQAEVILAQVIRKLDLARLWGEKFAGGGELKPAEALQILRGRIDLRPVRNTSLIDIRVYSEKAEEAAAIANAIATNYQAHRIQERIDKTLKGVEVLQSRVEDQETKIRAAQTNVDNLREVLNISDIMSVADAPTALLTAEAVRRIKAEAIDKRSELVQQETMLQGLKGLLSGSNNVAQAIQAATMDLMLSELLNQQTLAEQTLVVKQKDYGDVHPDVIKVKAQLVDLEKKIWSRIEGLMRGLETRVTALSQGVNELQVEVDKAQKLDLESARKSRPYFEAKRKLEELQRFGQILNIKIAAENIDVSLPKTAMVEIVEYAKPSLRPVRPNKPLNIALGIIVGLVVGIGLAFFIEYLDTSVKTIDDVERALQAPVLGVIPQNVGLVLNESIESPHAEAYRVLRTNILFSRKDEKLNSIAVVSAGAGEGKSTTVFNLAATFAMSGQRVILVDSDLRRPTLHKILKCTNSLGLTSYLLRQNKLEEVIQTTSSPMLDFLASGKLPSSSLGILSSAKMRELINELKQRYDFVFFDSPPIMGVSDASILASAVDMTLQVIQYRRYPQPMNIRAKQLIEKVGGHLVGIVLNNINMSQDESYYYYSGYYHDYYSTNAESDSAVKTNGSDDGSEKGSPTEKSRLEIKQKY